MIHPPHVRFSDRSDLVTANRSDFTVRRYYTVGRRLHTLGLMAALVAVGVFYLVTADTLMGSLLCFVVGCAMLFVTKAFEKNRSSLLATEFLNALLSSALGLGSTFCMIVRPDGEIVYLDRTFQAQFPHFLNQPTRTLEMLFSMYSMPPETQARIKELISLGKGGSLAASLQAGKDKTPLPQTIDIEPIPRPSGYVLLRGRKAA